MNVATTLVVLAALWAAVTGVFTLPNLALGVIVAAIALLVLRDLLRHGKGRGRALPLASLAVLFVRELLLSAVSVAAWAVRPNVRKQLRPAFVAFPLTVTTDLQITLLANLITLTPGMLCVDVSVDRKFLHVHALDCPDPGALKANIANGFERKIIEAFQ